MCVDDDEECKIHTHTQKKRRRKETYYEKNSLHRADENILYYFLLSTLGVLLTESS